MRARTAVVADIALSPLDERNVTPEEQFGTLYSRHTFAASGSLMRGGDAIYSQGWRESPLGPGTLVRVT